MADHASHNLPPTFKGLQFTSSTEPASVVDVPTPLPAAGTVIVRPLYSDIVSYAKEIYCNGNPRAYNYPSPMIPGTSCICRIAAAAPDTPHLKPGMLVFMSGLLWSRDNTSVPPILQGMYMGATAESEALMKGEWRNGSWAELVKVPAENIHVLDEQALTKGLGYDIEDLGYISTLAVAYGGLNDVGVRPGETVLVAPATGNFGSAAVFVALAMGAAKVIAMGRSQQKLKAVLEGAGNRVVTVPISGSVEDDTAALQAHGPIDVYFDISPPVAGTLSHIKSGIIAPAKGPDEHHGRRSGRCRFTVLDDRAQGPHPARNVHVHPAASRRAYQAGGNGLAAHRQARGHPNRGQVSAGEVGRGD